MKSKSLTNKNGDVRALNRDNFKRFRPAREVDPELIAAHRAGKQGRLDDALRLLIGAP